MPDSRGHGPAGPSGDATPDTLVVLVDNEVAVQNLTKLAGSCHLPVRAEKLGDKRFEVTMDVAAPVTPEPDAEVCLPDQRGGYRHRRWLRPGWATERRRWGKHC